MSHQRKSRRTRKVLKLGDINGHIVGKILKELVRRAIVEISSQRDTFSSTPKAGLDGKRDLCTSADLAAQDIYVKPLGECFPNIGMIGEEKNLKVAAKKGYDAYFTIDPLDGTKAFERGQSHGVGTMIALVVNGKVEAAYVGDINTEEIFGYRPGSDCVHRITKYNQGKKLEYDPTEQLIERYILLRRPATEYSMSARNIIHQCFEKNENMSSSIGTWMARLWKGEVGGALLPIGWETPWDSSPVIGISQKLGYLFFRPVGTDQWQRYTPRIPRRRYRRDHEILMIHELSINDPAISRYLVR